MKFFLSNELPVNQEFCYFTDAVLLPLYYSFKLGCVQTHLWCTVFHISNPTSKCEPSNIPQREEFAVFVLFCFFCNVMKPPVFDISNKRRAGVERSRKVINVLQFLCHILA